jgi:hypothetical protein
LRPREILSDLSFPSMNRKRRRALAAQADNLADLQNTYGPGRPNGTKRRPQRPLGNSRQALLRRLRRDHPQLHELVLSGQISPFRAAVVAGFRQPPGKQPKRPADPTEQGHNDSDVLLELWLGPHPGRGSLFDTPEELRAAWDKHKAEVMRMWARGGHRPRGFWEFETDLKFPGYDAEPAFLLKHDLLSEAERRQLEAQWAAERQRRPP